MRVCVLNWVACTIEHDIINWLTSSMIPRAEHPVPPKKVCLSNSL